MKTKAMFILLTAMYQAPRRVPSMCKHNVCWMNEWNLMPRNIIWGTQESRRAFEVKEWIMVGFMDCEYQRLKGDI